MKIIPVIHHVDSKLTLEQAKIVSDSKAFGIFLISMTGDNEHLPMLAKVIKSRYPHLKLGTNLLGNTALETVKINLDFELDMSWSDEPILHGDNISPDAIEISEIIKNSHHLFFNSVAFKYQKIDPKPEVSTINSYNLGFIPTTSGEATGKAANLDKISKMAEALQVKKMGLASGLTPNNIKDYFPYIEYGLVSTGISKNFHEIEPKLLALMIDNSK